MLKPYVRRFGPGALAYTTVTNDEFRHFFVPGVGSLAYLLFTRYGRRVVMACNDPLAPRALWLPLTARFFAFEPSAYVSHASREYATVLASMGKIVNHFGIEPIVSVSPRASAQRSASCPPASRRSRFCSPCLAPTRSLTQNPQPKNARKHRPETTNNHRSRQTSTTFRARRCASRGRRSAGRATRA